MKRTLACLLLAFAMLGAGAADRTLRWSSAGDILTFDVHAAADSLSQSVSGQIYEQLVRRGKDTKFEPALATSVDVVQTPWNTLVLRWVQVGVNAR